MKIKSWKWFTGTLTVTLLLASGAHASVLLEPLIETMTGRSDLNSTPGIGSVGFGGSMRLGMEKEDMFTALEGRYDISNLVGGGTSGSLYSIGFTAGGTLTYVPLRLWFGFDFSDSYSDTNINLGGAAMRAGAGYFFTDRVVLNMEYSMHNFSGVGIPAGSKIVTTSTISSVHYTSLAFSLSMPISLDLPEKPWRVRSHRESVYTH